MLKTPTLSQQRTYSTAQYFSFWSGRRSQAHEHLIYRWARGMFGEMVAHTTAGEEGNRYVFLCENYKTYSCSFCEVYLQTRQLFFSVLSCNVSLTLIVFLSNLDIIWPITEFFKNPDFVFFCQNLLELLWKDNRKTVLILTFLFSHIFRVGSFWPCMTKEWYKVEVLFCSQQHYCSF